MKAVDLLLSPHGSNDPVQKAKRLHTSPHPPHHTYTPFQQYILTGDSTPCLYRYFTATQDAAGCLQRMPDHMTRERLVLKALHCHGYSDYGCTRALCNIPYNSRSALHTLWLVLICSLVFIHQLVSLI